MTDELYRVLLAKDSDALYDEVVKNLNTSEFIVGAVDDSSELLQVVLNDSVNIILIDLSRADAPDLVHSLKTHHLRSTAELRGIPVVVISSALEVQSISDAIAAGADDYIALPSTPALVQTRIKTSVRRLNAQNVQIQNVLSISDHIQRVLTDPEISMDNSQGKGTNIDEFLGRALTEIKGMYNADGGTVYYRENNALRFVVMQTDSLGIHQGGATGNPITFPPLELYDPQTKEPNLQYIAAHAVLEEESINIPDVYKTTEFDISGVKSFDSRQNYQTASCLAIPLKSLKGDVIGVLQMINARNEYGHTVAFDTARQEMAKSLCSHVATIISNQLLVKQQEKMMKIEGDIRIGRQIQEAFLPTTFPEVPGWELSSYFRAAREVAGDFYDAFEMPGNRLGMLIADVCDKGVGAALFMSLMRSLFRAYAMQNYSVNWSNIMSGLEPADKKDRKAGIRHGMPSAGMTALENAVKLTNNYVATIHGDLSMFATTFFGVLQPSTGSFIYINGGHCPPFIIDGNGKVKQRIEATGPAVGMFADAVFEIGEVTLEPEDTLFAFTDGIPDSRNPARKLFTEERLIPLLEEPFSSAKELLNRVQSTVTNFIGDAVQFDDITMLCLRRAKKD